MDSRLEKYCKLFLDFIIAVAAAIIVPLFFSKQRNTGFGATEQTFTHCFWLIFSYLVKFWDLEQNFQIGLAKSFSVVTSSFWLANASAFGLGDRIFIYRKICFGRFFSNGFGSSYVFIKRFFESPY